MAARKRLKMGSALEIRRTLNRISNMLINGELDPKTANALIYAANAVLTSIRVDEQESRLDALEKLLYDLDEKG